MLACVTSIRYKVGVRTLNPAGVIICVDIRQNVVWVDEKQPRFSPASRDGSQGSASFGSRSDYNALRGDPTFLEIQDGLENGVINSLVEDVNLAVSRANDGQLRLGEGLNVRESGLVVCLGSVLGGEDRRQLPSRGGWNQFLWLREWNVKVILESGRERAVVDTLWYCQCLL